MPATAAGRYRVAHLYQPSGWLEPGFLEIDAQGLITVVSNRLPDGWEIGRTGRLDGYVVPGMINLHSHTHQRGLAGHGEGVRAGAAADDFWHWREQMYRFVNPLDPEQFEAIATQTYLEMVKGGFTSVGEFHYLHQDRDGRPYANPAELSERVLTAVEQVGIGMTLLPSLYRQGGIGKPPTERQRRFVHRSVDDYLQLVAALSRLIAGKPALRLGMAPHSLRAVGSDELRTVLAAGDGIAPGMPIHIHVAEQRGEVAECLARLGARPAEWLLSNLPVDERWTFIHATHCLPEELDAIAARGVVVGLCPITEANLGDGRFPLRTYHESGGHFGIGTDSNLTLDPTAELRMLEYGQRLAGESRAILVRPGDALTEQPGRLLYDLALEGGARSLSQPVGAILPGKRADLVELDPDSDVLAGHRTWSVLDGWLFAGPGDVVRNVMVAGTWVIRDGRHEREQEIRQRFRRTMRAIWEHH